MSAREISHQTPVNCGWDRHQKVDHVPIGILYVNTLSTVQEWEKVSSEAIQSKIKVHVGGSELPENDPLRMFKGRTVCQGNNVKDESADVALLAELGSSPANMEAGKSLDAYGSMPGSTVTQADGKQAYTRCLHEKDARTKEWVGKYIDPVVQLVVALYFHPDSGGLYGKSIGSNNCLQSDSLPFTETKLNFETETSTKASLKSSPIDFLTPWRVKCTQNAGMFFLASEIKKLGARGLCS